jgi:endo-1,4-beta-D-glucanase Y
MTRLPSSLFIAVALAACPGSPASESEDASAIPSGLDASTIAGADASLPSPPDAHAPAPPDASLHPDAATAAGLGHAFGTHGGYFPAGVIFPSTQTQAQLDKATADFYDAWKKSYLLPACKAGQYLVKSQPATDDYTVSEGHGYGMLLTVLMAGHDPDARTLFDGLYAFYDEHRSDVNGDLMAWAQDSSCTSVDGPDSATDGDLDIAYSLLLADKQWGSGGSIDYLAQARRIISAILASDIHPQNSILVGDWASDPSDSCHDGTRPSDFATGHLKAFAQASGVARWNDVVDKTYSVIDTLQAQYAPSTGLLPDFAVKAPTATPQPAPANWLEGSDDGHYSWNACRTPWRIGTDFLMSGEPRSQAAVRRMNAWILGKTGGDPTKIRDGYDLSGKVLGTNPEIAFVAPFGVAAMIEPASGTNQAWLDALWTEIAARPQADYFGDSLKLLSMIVMSGNWWTPG